MERHPLIFLTILLAIGALNALTLALLAQLHRRLPDVTRTLTALSTDVRDLTEEVHGNALGQDL